MQPLFLASEQLIMIIAFLCDHLECRVHFGLVPQLRAPIYPRWRSQRPRPKVICARAHTGACHIAVSMPALSSILHAKFAHNHLNLCSIQNIANNNFNVCSLSAKLLTAIFTCVYCLQHCAQQFRSVITICDIAKHSFNSVQYLRHCKQQF